MRRSLSFLIILVIYLQCIASLLAQDPVFSQSFASPLTINPGLTGLIQGNYRVSAIYRDQWGSILDNSFKTYSATGDVRFQRDVSSSTNPDYFGVGMQFYADRVSLYDFNTTQISIFGAYHKSLDKRKNQYLSAGIQLGVVQKNVNYEDLNFNDEFNGVNGYTLTSNERLPPNNFGFGDFAVGIHYTGQPNNNTQIFAGFAYHHLGSPNISFYRADFDLVGDPLVNNWYRKMLGHLSVSFDMNEAFSVIPRMLYVQQGPHRMAQLGSSFKYKLLKSEGRAYQFGAWLRVVDNEENFGLESFVVMAGIELNGILIGISYDTNINDLTSELQGQGVFEFSISFIGEYDNQVNFCPKF